MNLTPKQTIKGTVTETQGLNGSLKDIPSVKGTVTETQSLRGSMKDIPSLDNTLTKEGYAADAKAVGEALDSKAPISHTEDKGNPHGVTASQVGARPDTWMPSASEIGARPDNWMPTASDVGARANTWTPTAQEVGARPDDWMPTAEQVGARPNTWTPTAEDVGARPNTWMPTASDVGARENTWMPTAEDVGARPSTWIPTAEQVGARPDTWTPTAEEVGARPNTWMPTAEEVGAAPVIESVSHPGCYFRMVGGEREWINPPMVLGVEYRTTERLDKLVVYTKMTSFGEMPHNSSKTVQNVVAGSIFFVDGIVFNADGIPIVTFATNQSVSCDFAGSHVSVGTTWDFNNCVAYLIVKYYKR